MQTFDNPERDTWPAICTRPAVLDADIVDEVRPIMWDVKHTGDEALINYTAKFDKVHLRHIVLSKPELEKRASSVQANLRQAIRTAARNISVFHKAQYTQDMDVETTRGVHCMQRSVPIENVGIYIPGGTAPLLSTVLMLGIPARIAGCRNVVLCSPPGEDGHVHPAIAYAALQAGIEKICLVGGAQAIAAMAYGTESIRKVDKIFGPGNTYVTVAKMLVQMEGVAIDMPAGPSELLVYADGQANPAFVAADLISQAEHGADSQVILVTHDKKLRDNVLKALQVQLEDLPRRQLARASLGHSRIVIFERQEEAVAFINAYAPEHLILNIANADSIAREIQNAGSVFIGPFAAESIGDYASGTNHTLPTSGYARMYSGVNLDAFMKKITFQKVTAEGLRSIGRTVEILAQAEQLEGHRRAVSVRLKALET